MAFGSLSVKGRALRYLAQREHSRAELARKLARFAEDDDTSSAADKINVALDELNAHGLLSDARTASSVLLSQGKRFGERRLKQTLQSKGLAPDLVASTLAQARTTELARALEVWKRKFGELPRDAAERGKQMRFLMGRGFSGDTITRVMRASAEAQANDPA